MTEGPKIDLADLQKIATERLGPEAQVILDHGVYRCQLPSEGGKTAGGMRFIVAQTAERMMEQLFGAETPPPDPPPVDGMEYQDLEERARIAGESIGPAIVRRTPSNLQRGTTADGVVSSFKLGIWKAMDREAGKIEGEKPSTT